MSRIAIIEDQTLVLDSLARLIAAEPGLEVVATGTDAADAVDLARRSRAELVLMDVVTAEGHSGLAAAARLLAALPGVKVLAMTALPEITFIEEAKRIGVHGFCYKNVTVDVLVGTIRATLAGYNTFPDATPEAVLQGVELTPTEVAILRLACESLPRAVIASELGMSEGSTKAAIGVLLAKTGFDSLLKLAVFAAARGYIVPEG
jgi:DNA-binding NarL/FixJ family response regulator